MSKSDPLLIVLGTGGHTKQMLRLVDLLGEGHQYQYVVADYDTISESKIRIPGKVYHIVQPREKHLEGTDNGWDVLLKMPKALIQAWHLLSDAHPAAVIGAGPSLQIPLAMVARLRRIPVIFIETASRGGDVLSMTARIMYKLNLADRFYVQWEHHLEHYPKARYAGRLL